MKTTTELETIVLQALEQLATEYNLECPSLTSETKPMSDVEGLDSLHCVELLVTVGEKVALNTNNEVFWDQHGTLRTIGEVAAYLYDRQVPEGT